MTNLIKAFSSIALFSLLYINCSNAGSIKTSSVLPSVLIDKSVGDVEASAVAYYNGELIIISDDNPNDVPYLYFFSTDGEYLRTSRVKDLVSIEDMESMAVSGDDIYICTSLNKAENKREKLIQVDGKTLTLKNEINLYDVLQSSGISFLENAISETTIDIEGLAYNDSTFYFGLKDPVEKNRSTIISVKNLFSTNPLVAIFQQVKVDGGITSLEYYNGSILIVSKGGADLSYIWKLDIETKYLSKLFDIDVGRVEGISVFNDSLILVKDGNEENSQIIFLKDAL